MIHDTQANTSTGLDAAADHLYPVGGISRWELLFYAVLLTVAGVMRFWDLGSRAIHHDESLHAFFSMDLIGGFKHNPLMHGPLQFFGISAFTNVFGSSDAAVRALAASLGTILVGLPVFLRSYLGRWGSIIASLFLAFSPTLLYYSRFARNDIYIAVWTLGLIICVWGYLSSGKARYLYVGAAALSLSVATKENTYITVIILVSYLFILWLRQPFAEPEAAGQSTGGISSVPPRLRSFLSRTAEYLAFARRLLIPSAVLFTIAAAWVASSILWSLDIYGMIGRVDFTFSVISLLVAVGAYFVIIAWAPVLRGPVSSLADKLAALALGKPEAGRFRRLLQGPSVSRLSRPGALWLLILLLMLPLTAAGLGLVQESLDLTLANPNALGGAPEGHKPGFPDGVPVGNISLAVAIGLVIHLLVIAVAVGLKWHWKRFLVSSLIFWGIFVFFFTTIFTNLGQGLGSGLWQSLGYWIAQQEVERGAQPWYYYGLLTPAYEFLPLVIVLGGAGWYLFSQWTSNMYRFWLVHAVLVSLFFLLLLSTFWMPDSNGHQLVLGLLFLGFSVTILALYLFADRSFLHSRVFIADVAMLLLYMLNWVIPRVLELRDLPVFSHLWDARSPLIVIILMVSIALITYKTVSKEGKFTCFLVYWLALTLVLYGFAGEKMPWLMVHTALPLAILAAKILGTLLKRIDLRRTSLNPRWLMGLAGVLLIGMLTFHTVRVSVEASYGIGREGKGDIPIEMLVYTQTSPDIKAALARIDDLAASGDKGELLPILVDRTNGFGYPWRWYLRDYKTVQWLCLENNPNDNDCNPMSETPTADVLIVHHRNRDASIQFLTEFDDGQRIRHRAWFPEFETYKEGFGAMSLHRFFSSLASADSWRQWWNYFAFRELDDDKPTGSEDSVLFFRLESGAPAESRRD